MKNKTVYGCLLSCAFAFGLAACEKKEHKVVNPNIRFGADAYQISDQKRRAGEHYAECSLVLRMAALSTGLDHLHGKSLSNAYGHFSQAAKDALVTDANIEAAIHKSSYVLKLVDTESGQQVIADKLKGCLVEYQLDAK